MIYGKFIIETKFRHKISKLSFDNLLEEKGVLEQIEN